jgi:hypothetical protein
MEQAPIAGVQDSRRAVEGKSMYAPRCRWAKMEIPEKEVLKMANVCTSRSGQVRGHASKFLTDNNFFD